jgi:hypothetical protein
MSDSPPPAPDDRLAAATAAAGGAPSRPEETRLVMRGVKRLLRDAGYACVEEMTFPTGRRADVVALGGDGSFVVVEVKSSVEDFRADAKWPDYRQFADRLYFATSPRVPQEIFPADAGLIVADAFGAEVLREAPEHRLAAPTRKMLTLRFARLAALRLHGLADPERAS